MSLPFKRRKITTLLNLALIGSALALTGCVEDGNTGPQGSPGEQGTMGATGAVGTTGAAGENGSDLTYPSITRLATLPLGAEATGMFLTDAGDFFFNTQHPSTANTAPNNVARVGVITGQNMNNLADDFAEVAVPATDADKQIIKVAAGSFQSLMAEGDILGSSNDVAGEIRLADDSSALKTSNDPDFNAFVPTNAENTAGYLFTNWEDRPGGMSRIEVSKDNSGQWSVGNGLMLDFSAVKGTWVNCFGTLSPWMTPLSSEELYFDNTADWFDSTYQYFSNPQSLANYLSFPTDGSGAWPNPYRYGYIVEISDPEITATPVKHFSMGRFSHENAVVMPDNKTVYLSDDGTDVVFYKFVADVENDLSTGTLYAGKFAQMLGAVKEIDFRFSIEWVELAHGDNTTIESWISEYDSATIATPSYVTDAEVAAWAADKMDNGVLDTVTDNRVAFLESRKAAKALGATAEFRKMEGVNINYSAAKNGSVPYMYLAMSEISKGMSDGMGDIQVPENKCGIVYRMRLDANYNVAAMEPAIIGGQYNADNAPNACPTDSISNPDNVVVMKDGRVIIGEDTSKHENNMIWVWKSEE